MAATRAACLRCVAARETDLQNTACGVAACTGAMHREIVAGSFKRLPGGAADPRSKHAGATRSVRSSRVVRIAAHARAPGAV
ncbi:hypothetical protein BZL54_16280 [Burkholderia ubonensis subsp. mesacidophila]|uniref:Uncharacterized protein n=1 Tax=Burkholderia ubonensis subsp. mesacidophila TaxID=265293 RepID=A0A2A4FD30_9BURK|nr:hypothetical protein BZL54_16280 [Burkholderia ubonensis subsp. mesacidophila]